MAGSPAPSPRALARRPGAELVVRPSTVPVRRPVPYRPAVRRPRPAPRLSGPLPGRRTVRLWGRSYDRDQVVAIVSLALVAFTLAPEAAPEPSADVSVEAAASAAPATAQAVIEVAATQVGVTEARDRGTPFHDAYGIARHEPWCAVWIWWVFQQAGHPELIHPKTAWTPALYGWFADRGRADRTPRVGSLVFFNWPGDRKDRIQHVGLVVGVEGDTLVTYEANTQPGPGGDQSNGDGVYERRRPFNSSVVGFGHPDYSTS